MTIDAFLADLPLPEPQYSTDVATLDAHSRDWRTAAGDAVAPDAVIWPESTDDVSAVLAAADAAGIPVTPFAAATGLEGGAVPVERGISLDLTRMDSILEIRPGDFQIDVEPGVVGADVDEAVAAHGLFFAPLPTSGAMATIGGMIATNASGKRTVKYGKVGDWVREIEAVLADGTVITTGTRADKTSSGYDLKDLVIGSEGTLAVVTRATLELAGRPEQTRGARAVFPSLADATEAIADAIQSGVDVSAIELIDALSARMVNEYTGSDLPDAPMVFLEFQANHHVDHEVAFCEGVFAAHDPVAFETAGEAEMAELWEAREELADATANFDPDLEPVHSGDIAVPISAYPDVLRYIRELAAEHDVLVPCFGHAGDGNVHFDVLVETGDAARREVGHAVDEAIVRKAIDLGGTATGEHGVGRGKRGFMEYEHGAGGVATMRRIKRALDPNGTLNPGKVLPDET